MEIECIDIQEPLMRSNYQIPALEGLEFNVVDFFLQVFAGRGPKDRVAYSLMSNFIRLTDLAVDEYNLGRKAFLDFISSEEEVKISRAYRAASHFEVCINAIHRAIAHLKVIRSRKDIPTTIKDLCPRRSVVLAKSVTTRVTGMRNLVMHLEEGLNMAEIASNESIMMLAGETGVELGKYRFTYVEMVTWLRELHNIAQKFSHYSEIDTK